MDVSKKAATGIFWSLIEGWGSQVLSLIIFFLLTRLLSPEAFGLVAMANVFLAFMTVFLEQGFAQALVQRQALEPEHIDTAFWTNVVIGLGLAGLGIAGANAVATGFNQPQLTPILRWLSLLFIVTSLSNVQTALLERDFAFQAIARRSLLGFLCSGVVGISLALYGFGVWSLVGQKLTKECVSAVVLWRASSYRPQLRFSVPHFFQLCNFGISLFLLKFVSFFNDRGNDFLIGYTLGPVPLGYYTIARRIIEMALQLLVVKASQVALPTFSRLQEDLETLRHVFYRAIQLTSLIAFPIFLGLAILAPEVVRLLFGNQWDASIPIVRVLAFSGMVQSVSFFKGQVLVAMGKPSWRLWQSLLSIVLNIVGFAIAYRWGMVAIAFAYTIRRYLVFPIGQWAIYLLIRFSWRTYLRQFYLPLAASTVMAIALLIIQKLSFQTLHSDLWIMVTCAVLGSITYGAIVCLYPPEVLLELLQSIRLSVANKRQK